MTGPMLTEMLRAQRELGRVEAVLEASRILLRAIDGAKEKTTREALGDARRKVERLTVEALGVKS